MAHYALLDDTSTVTQVIVGKDSADVPEGTDSWEQYYGSIYGQRCVRTSYNTRAGVHSEGGTPFRGNYAGVGFSYNEALDVFLPPKPDAGEWELDEATYTWIEVVEIV